MGKFSEALEKAGYQDDTNLSQQEGERNRKPAEDIHAPASATIAANAPSPELSKVQCGQWDKRLFHAVHNDIYLPEVFKVLRSRILHPKDGGKVPKTIMVTSATPKEGKSFVTANLGISLAHGMDQHSLLVDCDLRKPTLAALFGIKTNTGLVDYLRDQVNLSTLITKTSMSKLSILASGKPAVNPAELLSSSLMHALVDELSARYEDRIIIFDTPPVLVAAESSVLAGQVDTVILVVRQGVANSAEVQKVVDIIGAERIIGIVFNDRVINYFEKSLTKGYVYY
jgi:protein-tyrosine kinase